MGKSADAGVGLGQDSGKQSSVTKAGIGVSTCTDTNGAIKPILDQTKVQDEANAQAQITQVFGKQATKAVGDYAEQKYAHTVSIAHRGSGKGLTSPGFTPQTIGFNPIGPCTVAVA